MSQSEPGDFDRRIDEFRERTGFANLSQESGPEGVRANWEELRKALDIQLKPMRSVMFSTNPLEPGLAEADWKWRDGSSAVSVQIFVSGAGSKKAQEKLFSLGSETTMVRIPYEPGPSGLGDLSIHHFRHRSEVVMWVYRNVCVSVGNDGSGVQVEPIARTIQRFMEARRVSHVAQHLPRIDRVDTSSHKIRVGEEWHISISLGKTTEATSVLTKIRAREDQRLEPINVGAVDATFRGMAPGPAHVDVVVVDRTTLLSPLLSATVEVLPALGNP